jgi:hypothetical protein
MTSLELLDQIRSGPAELVLDKPLRFAPPSFFNTLCTFKKLLRALQSSKTIRTVTCKSQLHLRITEAEWVLLVKTIARIKNIQILRFVCKAGSRDFQPFQAVADAVNNARSLRDLRVLLEGENFPEDSSGLAAFANALREHTALQKFWWFDLINRLEAVQMDSSPDLVLQTLPACRHLQEVSIATTCASADAMKTLLQLPKNTYLIFTLNTEYWLAVTDGIRQGYCNIEHLYLSSLLRSSSSETTTAVKALASAIRLDRNLKLLKIDIENNFTDEAAVALAEALTVNKTLRKITLSARLCRRNGRLVQDANTLSTSAYDAFSAMLCVNTSIVLELPAYTGGDERIVDSRNQVRIEQRLNHVGRGRLLSSSQKPRKKWVNALNELNSSNVDESPEFNVSCLYSLLRLNPATCI